MHMALAERLIRDSALPEPTHAALQTAWGAFLLGSIAPDARVSSGLDRAHTHFFEYHPTVDPPAVTEMLRRHPELRRPALTDAARIAFVAGYVAHLAMDEVWCTDILFPCFFSSWGTPRQRLVALHVLLAYLDNRDLKTLPATDYDQLRDATPQGWLPFIGDSDLAVWRDVVARQLGPAGSNQTFDILGKRIDLTAGELAAYVGDEHRMHETLWANVRPQQVARVEAAMYGAVLQTVIGYMNGG